MLTRFAAFFLALALCTACASWLPAPEPMYAIDHERPGPRATCLMVFLPGGGDHADSFEKHGFVEELARRKYSIDMVASDATLGYYGRGVFSERLADDVVRRRVQRGYKELWLVGNSLGGFGTLLYSRQRPVTEVQGVLALAPYLGSDKEVFAAIRAAGGLARWHAPPSAPISEKNLTSELWRWLQGVTAGREPGPALYLGYGEQDPLTAKTSALLAAAMPRDHVFAGSGGHNWTTWRKLFSEFLDRGPLAERCR
jgi:pimeloyl-ACP methyl ester carboxylesterase